MDETYLEWNRVAGKKKIAAVNFLRAKGHKTMVIIFAVSDESTRYIAQQHLHLAYKANSFDPKVATPLQTLVNDRRSPIYAGLANLSDILTGRSPRLVLIWRFRGCNSLADWFHHFPDEALTLFRACVGQAAGIERRQRGPLSRFAVFTVGDPCMPHDEQLMIALDFANTPAKELWPGVQADYWQRVRRTSIFEVGIIDDAVLVDCMVAMIIRERQLLARAYAFAKFSVAPCEAEHAKNRSSASVKDQVCSFARLASTSVHRQLHEKGFAEELHQLAPLPAIEGVAKISKKNLCIEDRVRTYVRPVPAQRLHRTDWIQDQLAISKHFDPCTKFAWEQWRIAWDALSASRRIDYNVQSEAASVLVGAIADAEDLFITYICYENLFNASSDIIYSII